MRVIQRAPLQSEVPHLLERLSLMDRWHLPKANCARRVSDSQGAGRGLHATVSSESHSQRRAGRIRPTIGIVIGIGIAVDVISHPTSIVRASVLHLFRSRMRARSQCRPLSAQTAQKLPIPPNAVTAPPSRVTQPEDVVLALSKKKRTRAHGGWTRNRVLTPVPRLSMRRHHRTAEIRFFPRSTGRATSPSPVMSQT